MSSPSAAAETRPIAVSTQRHWRGFTPMADFVDLEVVAASGTRFELRNGRHLIDGVSNLWCNVHGHDHPAILDAIERQLHRVPHVTTLGMACETTNALADRLATITPGPPGHVFFASDGSAAVEAAIKMAFQYWQQTADPRPRKTRFLSLGNAYHGDTTGSVSLGGIERFHHLFGPMLFETLRIASPCTFRTPEGFASATPGSPLTEDQETRLAQHHADRLESVLERHAEEIAAVVMEPLVQGAAGMIQHPRGFLRRVRELCDRFETLLIVDEVATGFGRTGEMFACQHEDVAPDILCVGKGLTGGYLPLSAAVASPTLFESFLGDAPEGRQLFHGHTYGGNPMAAAAALATLDVFQSEGTLDRVEPLAARLRDRIRPLDRHPNVASIRGRGLMFGIELLADREHEQTFAPDRQVGRRVCEAALRRGLYLRPLADVIVLMPAPAMEHDTLDELGDIVLESVVEVLGPIAS